MVITVEWPVLPIALHLKHKQTTRAASLLEADRSLSLVSNALSTTPIT